MVPRRPAGSTCVHRRHHPDLHPLETPTSTPMLVPRPLGILVMMISGAIAISAIRKNSVAKPSAVRS
jgi:hypothetical protein